jgi:hypothetical protein
MAENHNAEIFAATTLFVVLGTSVLTARVSPEGEFIEHSF